MPSPHYDALVERAGHGRYVLLGAASHGTHEFHRERAEITKRLITEAGFTAVAIEGGWAEARRVDRFVRGAGDDASARQALGAFRRFPAWMWRNEVIVEFVAWLRGYNDALPLETPHVGFYGIDLYGRRASRAPAASGGGDGGREERFDVEQDARAARSADQYRRALSQSSAAAWTVRARHMADTLDAVAAHAEPADRPARAVLWGHNAHVGDAAATELGRAGRRSVGQLMRRRAGAETLLAGFTTYGGTVTAAREWGGPAECRELRPAVAGSYEEYLHRLDLRRVVLEPVGLPGQLRERAIGIIHRPQDERLLHYFDARLGAEFDLVVHLDETRAVEPLERMGEWERNELPATYPWGL
jgi:erythromycin esterase-like protein